MNLKIKSLSWLLPAAAMCLTACSSQEPGDGPNYGNDGEGIGYLSFTIQSQTRSSRADNDMPGDVPVGNEVFNNGDTQEYAICPNMASNAALFFDAAGNFYGMTQLQPYSASLTPDTNHGSHDDNYPETYYTYVTRWANTSAGKPTQVIVMLNAKPNELKELAESLLTQGTNALTTASNKQYKAYDAAGNYVYGVYKYDEKNYFTMTNSSFVDDANTDATITQIDPSQVCATAEQALANPITVYVERLLAKYQLSYGTGDIAGQFINPVKAEGASDNSIKVNYVASYPGTDTNLDYPSYQTISWQAYIANWGINGLENNARLLKNISTGNYFTDWNAALYHRSYWGESPDYAKETGFTTQYRNESYDPALESYNPGAIAGMPEYFGNADYDVNDETKQLNTLHYVSFNDLKNRGQYKYTAERTYTPEAGRKGYGPYRYGSHYLIGAQLIFPSIDTDLTTQNASNQLENVSDKYYAYNFYWATAEDYIRYAYRRMATQVADGREHAMKINNVGTSLKGVSDGYLYVEKNGAKVRLEVADAAEYFGLVSAQVVHGDGKQVLALKANKKLYLKTVESTPTSAAEFKELTADEVTGMIYTFSEPVKHFAKGAMYYAVPVQHNLGKFAATNTVDVTKDMDPQPIGQFGTVRNHWYRLTVSAINNIGIPVDNPDQPIIPDPEDEYYIAVEIVVIPWNVIDNGSVGL